MTEVRRLAPHDPLPEGRAHRVIVLRRFDEDDPRRIVTEITLTGTPGYSEIARPVQADGSAMSLDDAITAAKTVAETEGLSHIYVVDRTSGRLEHSVVEHSGDHSFAGEPLSDSDVEDGEQGPDMRDRKP